jgi:glucosamine--fructose-6-phosphate aminotransferase (isomerizing)
VFVLRRGVTGEGAQGPKHAVGLAVSTLTHRLHVLILRPPRVTQFESEIREQPQALRRQLELGRDATLATADQIRRAAPRFIFVAARGSSDNAARYAGYLFGVRNRLVVGLAAPSLFTIYGAPPSLDGALVVGISQSGRSPDIVAVLAEARRQGAATVAITNDCASPLAATAAVCLSLHVGLERAIAATKTYTAELLVLAMLSAALDGDDAAWRELAAIPDQVADALRAEPPPASYADGFREAQTFAVLGRGFNYATAFEIALKLKETSYVVAEAHSSADFRHGPAAMIGTNFPVVVVAPASSVLSDLANLFDLFEERNAAIVAISDRDEVLARARVPLRLPAGVPEWLSPIVSVVPGQLFALRLAHSRGLDPDRPRGLAKVTQTR